MRLGLRLQFGGAVIGVDIASFLFADLQAEQHIIAGNSLNSRIGFGCFTAAGGDGNGEEGGGEDLFHANGSSGPDAPA